MDLGRKSRPDLFPCGLLVVPGLVPLGFLAALLGCGVIGCRLAAFSGPGIATLFALAACVSLVLQGMALLWEIPRLEASAGDRTAANLLATIFGLACVVSSIVGAVAIGVWVASRG